MSRIRLAAAFVLFAGSVFAQSEAEAILEATKNIPATPISVSVSYKPLPLANPAASLPAVQNVLTVLGDNVENPGVPCLQCVTGAAGNTLGLVQPDSNVHADGVTSYAFDNYFVNNSFTGSCNFTFLVRDAANNYIVKLGPVSIPVHPGVNLVSTASAIPNNPGAVGAGLAITAVQCGSTKTNSAMPLYISYP